MPNGSRVKKGYYKEFDLAKFISEDRCVICGNSKSLNNVPEEDPAPYTDPPEYPIVTVAKDFFFIVCGTCRITIFEGLCIACGQQKEEGADNVDYVILDIAQHLAEEIIRVRSELTKWVPIIQKYEHQKSYVAPKKNVSKLFKKRRRH